MSANPDLLSRGEAARLAGVHANTVLAWERNGLIEVQRVRVKGKQETRIARSEIERMVGGGRRERRPRVDPVASEPEPKDPRIARRLLRGRERVRQGPLQDGNREFRSEPQASGRAL